MFNKFKKGQKDPLKSLNHYKNKNHERTASAPYDQNRNPHRQYAGTNSSSQMKTTTTKTTANEMRFIGPSSHLAEEHPVDMVALNLTNRNRKEAGPLGGLREQYENVRGKVGELEHIGNLGSQLSFEQRETLLYFEEIVSGQGGGMFEDSEEDSDYSEDNRKVKSKRNRKASEKNERKEKDYERGRSRYDSPDRGTDRPQLKRYTLMNDDEEFNASPNEYYTDSEEEENHQKDRRNHQVKEEGSSFGRDQIVNASVLRPSRSRHEPTNMEDDAPSAGNAMNFFKQMAKKNTGGSAGGGTGNVPASVSSAAAMFGGQLRRTVSRGEAVNSAPVGIAKMKSVARERSESRDRTNHRNRSIERTRTRGESRERTRVTQRGESRDRRAGRAESRDRRDRSIDRRDAAMSIRRSESRTVREPSRDRDYSVDRDKRRRDRSKDPERKRRDRSETREKRRDRETSEERKERRRRRRSKSRNRDASTLDINGAVELDEEREERRRKRRERRDREREERDPDETKEERRERRRKRSESKSRRTADGMSRQMSKMTLNDDADGLDAEERRERRREKKRRSRSKIRSKDPSEIPADDLEALIKASHRARDRSTDGQIRRKKKTRDPSTKRNRNRHHDQSTERPSAQV